MVRPGLALLLATLTFPAAAFAQKEQPPRKPEPGSVTGHITCADTQRPARLAKVALLAVPSATDTLSTKALEQEGEIGASPATEYQETGLDGSFHIANVPPGSYYVLVDMQGYSLPLAEFTRKDLLSSDVALRARIAQALTPVNVVSGASVSRDVSLQRGASVSGRVIYDDGSPAAELGITILARNTAGVWSPGVASRYRSGFGFVHTDDQGRYRVSGLPPGEYVTEAEISLNEYSTTTTSPPGHPDQSMVMRMQKTKYSLPLFSGNQLRRKDAVPYKLGLVEDRTGADLELPLSRLHRVTGQVTARDGHIVNAGKVLVVNADDDSKVTEADIDPTDHLFHLEFVPEGDFRLKTDGAKDTRTVQVANAAGMVPRFHDETKTLHTYAAAAAAVTIKGDTQGLVLTVQEQAKPNLPTAE